MPQPIILPQQQQRQNPYMAGLQNMLMQMFMMKFGANIRAQEAETAAKRQEAATERSQIRGGLISGKIRESVTPPKQRVGPAPTGTFRAGGKIYRHTRADKLQKAPDKMVKVDDKWMRQPQTFNPVTGEYTDTGKPYETKPPSKKGWQRKKKVFTGKDGKTYVQEFDYNPNTRNRENVGTPYRAPAAMNIWDFFAGAGQGDVDVDASIDAEIERKKKELEDLMNQ